MPRNQERACSVSNAIIEEFMAIGGLGTTPRQRQRPIINIETALARHHLDFVFRQRDRLASYKLTK